MPHSVNNLSDGSARGHPPLPIQRTPHVGRRARCRLGRYARVCDEPPGRARSHWRARRPLPSSSIQCFVPSLRFQIHADLAILPESPACGKPNTAMVNMLRSALLKVREEKSRSAHTRKANDDPGQRYGDQIDRRRRQEIDRDVHTDDDVASPSHHKLFIYLFTLCHSSSP